MDNLTVAVEVKDKLSELEAETVDKWIQQIFAPLESALKYRWSPECHYNIVVYSNRELVSYLKIIERICLIDGVPVKAGGIGCVMTPPHQRKKGFARSSLMEAKAVVFEKVQAQLGLLLCNPDLISFYEKFGWQNVGCPVTFQQPDGEKIWQYSTMVLTKNDENLAPVKIDLCGLPW